MFRKVLLIDDDRDIQDLMRISAKAVAGWELIGAFSGSTGIDRAKTAAIDAILLDILLPDLDGLQVFEQLQAHPLTRSIPIILLTAKALPSDRRRLAAIGAAGIITKPFDPIAVWEQIAAVLGW